jgi:hypothetical protein
MHASGAHAAGCFLGGVAYDIEVDGPIERASALFSLGLRGIELASHHEAATTTCTEIVAQRSCLFYIGKRFLSVCLSSNSYLFPGAGRLIVENVLLARWTKV